MRDDHKELLILYHVDDDHKGLLILYHMGNDHKGYSFCIVWVMTTRITHFVSYG